VEREIYEKIACNPDKYFKENKCSFDSAIKTLNLDASQEKKVKEEIIKRRGDMYEIFYQKSGGFEENIDKKFIEACANILIKNGKIGIVTSNFESVLKKILPILNSKIKREIKKINPNFKASEEIFEIGKNVFCADTEGVEKDSMKPGDVYLQAAKVIENDGSKDGIENVKLNPDKIHIISGNSITSDLYSGQITGGFKNVILLGEHRYKDRNNDTDWETKAKEIYNEHGVVPLAIYDNFEELNNKIEDGSLTSFLDERWKSAFEIIKKGAIDLAQKTKESLFGEDWKTNLNKLVNFNNFCNSGNLKIQVEKKIRAIYEEHKDKEEGEQIPEYIKQALKRQGVINENGELIENNNEKNKETNPPGNGETKFQ
jgi:hypothetical protein